jgi:hypothetical protein
MKYQVRIEFQRVQAFLFAVPRLRDMVGANVLLGETIRVTLPEIARKFGSASSAVTPPLGFPSSPIFASL